MRKSFFSKYITDEFLFLYRMTRNIAKFVKKLILKKSYEIQSKNVSLGDGEIRTAQKKFMKLL